MAVGKTKLYCLTRPDKSVEKQIPFSFINTNFLTIVYAYSAITQEVWRIGKYHIKFEFKLLYEFYTIALQ